MTEDSPSTGSNEPRATPGAPPPSVPPAHAPAQASGDRPATPGSPPAAPPPPAQTAVIGQPPPPARTGTLVADPPPPPSTPTAPVRPLRPGMGLLPVALGVGLLAAAVVLSAIRSRSDGDLDWSNYSVGLGATAVLVLVAAAAALLGIGRVREELVTWPGSIGVLAVGLMIGVGLDDVDGSADWLAYLVGGVVVLLSVVGYVAIRRGAFVVTAILGLGIAYIQLSDDVLVDIGDDDDQAIIAAAIIAVFVLAVTAVGWLLRTRALSGVVAGVIGLVGLNVVLAVLAFQQLFAGFFSDFSSGSSGTGSTDSKQPSYDNDVYVILAIAAVLTLVWALAASLDGNPGFTVLAIAMPATLVPTATFVLMVEHPTWWGAGLAAAGALLLAVVALQQLLARRKRT